MPEKKKKTTRIMKVTLDEDEFEKFDKGTTHSDSGLRNDDGRLSALPDIEPVAEEDLPQREVIRTERVYVQPEEKSLGAKIASAAADVVVDVLSDPEVQASIAMLFKAWWHYKIQPRIADTVQKMKAETKASKLIADKEKRTTPAYEFEVVDENHDRFVVSGEDAEKLVASMREKAKELSAMIYLLSNICVKDDKTEEEYVLEQSYIRQLVSDEARSTMQSLTNNRKFLDEGTTITITDFLNGYVRRGQHLIPIPTVSERNSHTM